MNSRAKGKRGELEARDFVRRYWWSPRCVRAAQVSGKFSADLLGGPPGLHIEVKRRKRIAALDFMQQSAQEAKEGEVPVVLMRADGFPTWVCMFPIQCTEDFIEALRRAERDTAAEPCNPPA